MDRVTSKITKVIALATVLLFVLSTVALAAMPNGTVVLGTKAFDLNYANETAHQSEITQAVVEAGNKIYVKGFDGKWVDNNTGDAIDASQIPAVSYKDKNGNVTQYEAGDGDAVIGEELKVVSVSAINASEIKVTFNKPVYKDSAQNTANYTLTTNGAFVIASATLQADGKSVILRANTAATLKNGDSYKVNVANVLDSNYQKMNPYTDTTKIFTDYAAPVLLSATYNGTAVKLTFNEPVQDTMVVKVNGNTVADAGTNKVTPSAIAGDYSVLTPAVALTSGNHTVTVYNAQDTLAANPNTQPVSTATVTVTPDTTPPSVVSLTARDATSFKVKFSERLASFTNTNLVVKKGTYTIPAANVNVVLDATDPTQTTYIVTVPLGAAPNPLYAPGETSVTLSVTVQSYQDSAGLVGPAYTGTVTLTQNTAGPQIVSAALNVADAANNKLVLKFNETIADPQAAKISVVKDGIIAAVNNVQVNVGDNTKLDVVLGAANYFATAGTFTVTLAQGAVKNSLGTPNGTQVTTVSYAGSAGTALIVVADNDGTVDAPGAGINTGDINIITIAYGEEMNDSASVLANYTLDGAAFPVGTTCYFADVNKNTVKIQLPAGTIVSGTDSKMLAISKNVTAKSGKVVQTAAGGQCNILITGFTDNTPPVLSSAQFVVADLTTSTTTGTIKLNFNESLSAVNNNADTIADFQVLVNGSPVTITAVNDVTPGDKAITLTLSSEINISQTVTVRVVPVGPTNAAMDVKDAAGNALTGGTTVTVSGKVTS